MRPHLTPTVISLGGSVQSSVMALMASRGAFARTPEGTLTVCNKVHHTAPKLYTGQRATTSWPERDE